MTIRLAHFSDPHLTAADLDWRWGDWCSKRLSSWLNLRVFGRSKRFAQADRVLARLVNDLRQRNVDRVIFSGDATALGFEAELSHTAQVLQIETLPGLAVPGNHDYCTRAAAASGGFERCFAAWQLGQRIDEQIYPFAQQVGDVWLIAVNSCTGNRWFWDASGRVGHAQLDRLRRLLQELPAGPRILITHYPVCLADSRPEGIAHGLNDLKETVEVASAGGIGLWLHGHRHRFYWHQLPPLAPFPVICAGSATQTGLWSYVEYAIDGIRLQALRRVFAPGTDAFVDAERFEVTLTPRAASK